MDDDQDTQNKNDPNERSSIHSSGIKNLQPLSSADDLVKRQEKQEAEHEKKEAELRAQQEQTEKEKAPTVSLDPVSDMFDADQSVQTQPAAPDLQPVSDQPTSESKQAPVEPAQPDEKLTAQLASLNNQSEQPQEATPSQPQPVRQQQPITPSVKQNEAPARPVAPATKDPIWAGVLGFFIWPFSIVAIVLGNRYKSETGKSTGKTLGIVSCVIGLIPLALVIILSLTALGVTTLH